MKRSPKLATALLLVVCVALIPLLMQRDSNQGTAGQERNRVRAGKRLPPTLITPPVITGTAQQGQTLTSSTGTWGGSNPKTYSYQWYRCDTGGNNCVVGPVGQSYLLAAGDVGKTFRVTVTATNAAGSATGTSSATAVVTASTTAPECSRTSMGSCPASYFTGPLGNSNLIPNKPGAFLIEWYGIPGTTWPQQQAGIVQRAQDAGRSWDGIGFHYDGGGTFGGTFGMNDPTLLNAEAWIHSQGAFPAVSWTPNYTVVQMNNGAADAIWAKAANYFKTLPFPVMLRAFWEFDAAGFPWGYGYNNVSANFYTAATFIAVWQRMVNIFRANGATNVGFWWAPEEGGFFVDAGGGSNSRAKLATYYPGDTYVDWVGADLYNVVLVGDTMHNSSPLHPGWATFNEIFNYSAMGSTLLTNHDQFGPRKPFVIGETGTWYDANYPTYKGIWYRDIVAAAKSMNYLRGIQFYDWDASAQEGPLNNFMVDHPTSNPDVYAGWKALVADPWFNTR